ncbi:hypothetical protein B566_EDAN011744 [Ephemera danica]|nr:hypothetical protein B566_EDAN011744 [Ephemera danica]
MRKIHLEPTSSVAPKLASGRLQELRVLAERSATILCLSQGFPVPHFRSVGPKLAGDRLQELRASYRKQVTILCLSQGFPVPSFR